MARSLVASAVKDSDCRSTICGEFPCSYDTVAGFDRFSRSTQAGVVAVARGAVSVIETGLDSTAGDNSAPDSSALSAGTVAGLDPSRAAMLRLVSAAGRGCGAKFP